MDALDGRNGPKARLAALRMLWALLLVMGPLAVSSGCSTHQPTEPMPFLPYPNLDAIPSWSPDGSRIAYLHEARDSSDSRQIAIIDTSGGSATTVKATSSALSPQIAWCPDGSRIAYYEGGISTIDLRTHAVRQWSGPFASYPAWSPDGRYLVYAVTVRYASAPDSTAGLRIIDTQVGDQRALLRNDSTATFGSYPIWSPDGTTVAFMSNESPAGGNIFAVGIDGTHYRQITQLAGWCADLQWSADGNRIYFHFTPSSAALGDPAQTASWVVNADGRNAHQLPLSLGDPRVHFWFQYSVGPGDRVAYSGLDAAGSAGVIWTMNIDGSQRRQVTHH